jgi:hypothetical protein
MRVGLEAGMHAIEAGCGYTLEMRVRLARNLANVGRLLGRLGCRQDALESLSLAAVLVEGQRYARSIAAVTLLGRTVGFRVASALIDLRAQVKRRWARVA